MVKDKLKHYSPSLSISCRCLLNWWYAQNWNEPNWDGTFHLYLHKNKEQKQQSERKKKKIPKILAKASSHFRKSHTHVWTFTRVYSYHTSSSATHWCCRRHCLQYTFCRRSERRKIEKYSVKTENEEKKKNSVEDESEIGKRKGVDALK